MKVLVKSGRRLLLSLCAVAAACSGGTSVLSPDRNVRLDFRLRDGAMTYSVDVDGRLMTAFRVYLRNEDGYS